MVYSTCALHPVEDEAVIARILRDTEGAVSLVDARQDEIQLQTQFNSFFDYRVTHQNGKKNGNVGLKGSRQLSKQQARIRL